MAVTDPGARPLDLAATPTSRWTTPRWLVTLTRRKIALAGAAIVAVTIVVGALAPGIAGTPTHMCGKSGLPRPTAVHWFGPDDVGRDVYSRVVYGARLSLFVGSAVVGFSFFFGLSAGLVAGDYRVLDNSIMRVMDGLMAFPAIFLSRARMAARG